jgi:Protein of unknown function (DUF2927)
MLEGVSPVLQASSNVSAPRSTPRFHLNALALWLAFLLAAALTLGAHAYAAEQTPTKQEIIDAFRQRVFFGKQQKVLLKWQVPVRFGVMSDEGVSPQWLKVVADDIDKVQRATQHEIVYTSEHITFLIVMAQNADAELENHRAQLAPFFSNDDDYKSFLHSLKNPLAVCASKYQTVNQGRDLLFISVVKAGSGDDVKLSQACLLTQIIKGMGVVNRTGKITSINSDDGTFTTMDEILLRLLYDTRIANEMTEAQSMPVISSIVNTEY